MTRVDPSRDRKDVLRDPEFMAMLEASRQVEDDFLALRNPAILATLRLTGKRRREVASLRWRDVWVDEGYLYFNFILLKKHRAKPPEAVKAVPLRDPLTRPVLEYRDYLEEKFSPGMGDPFWPRVRCVFGNNTVDPKDGLCDRSIYNVVREAGDAAGVVVWPHLFRETAGAEEARRDPSLYGVYKVANRLNITERTAWHYMRRHALNVIERDYGEGEASPSTRQPA